MGPDLSCTSTFTFLTHPAKTFTTLNYLNQRKPCACFPNHLHPCSIKPSTLMSEHPFAHSNDLPKPIIVKDCRPHTLPASSQHDLQHFLDFGGGVNPMAYKGYTFSKHGRFQFWQNHHTSTLSTSTNIQTQPHPAHRPCQPPNNHVNEQQHSSSSCCPLVGPFTPLFPIASLQQMATSTLLNPNVYVAWRFSLFVFSSIALILIVFENPEFIPTLSGFALLYSFSSNSIILTETLQYRLAQSNGIDHAKPNKLHGFIATVFQGSSLVCLMGIIGSFLVVLYGSASAAVTAASFFQTVTVYLLTTMMVLHLTDICFAPIPFTVLGTLPLQVVLISLFAVSLRGPSLKQILTGTAIMSVTSLGAGFMIHLFARGILFAVHRSVVRNLGTVNHPVRETRFDIV